MGLVTCYDAQGGEYQKEPVDARECVKHCGFTLTPPQLEPVGADSAPDASAPEVSEATAAPAAKAGKTNQK
jgi:hypothetical protein